MKCNVCKKEISNESKVCPYCGNINIKELNLKEKQTPSHPVIKFFSIVALIISYMIIVLPIAFSSIEGLSQNEASSSTDAAINQIMFYIYPMYIVYFILCYWINSHKLNFRLLIYPIMSALIYIIISIHMVCYSTGMAWFIVFSLIPEIIILIILFIVGFCKDLKEGERENQT